MPSSTSSSERTVLRRRLPWAFLGAVALFVATERALWTNARVLQVAERYTPRGDEGDPLVADAILGSLPPGRVVTLLGSSQVREGLDCATFEATLGRPCRSLAISGGTPLDALYIQGLLGSRPRRTVLALFPKLMHMAPKAPFSGPAAARVALAAGRPRSQAGAIWGPLGFGLLQHLSPTLRYKDAAWTLWEEVKEAPGAHWRLEAPPVAFRILGQEGRQPEQYFTNRLGVRDRDTQIGPFTRLQHAALERFLSLEQMEGRRPVVVDFPTHPGYPTTLPDDVRADYAALVARLAARADLRFVGASQLPTLASEDFLDFVHLGLHGRALVSARLAQIVAEEETRER